MTDHPFRNDATQKEKAAVAKNDRDLASHLLRFAEAQAREGSDGRWGAINKVNVTGRYDGPNRIPRLPDTSWSNQAAMVGHEQPLNADVNAMDPVGEYGEVQASLGNDITATTPSSGDVGAKGDGGSVASSPPSPKAAAGVEQHLAPPAAAQPNPQPTLRKRGL
jgi:hypothetical protein